MDSRSILLEEWDKIWIDWKYFNCFSALLEMTVKIEISLVRKLIIVSFIYLKASATDLAAKGKLGNGKLYKVYNHGRQRQESFNIRFRNQNK